MRQLKKVAAVVMAGVMALTMLAGCGGSSSNSDNVDLVNTMLKAEGNSITVTESSSLTKKAEEFVDILSDMTEIKPNTKVSEEVLEHNHEVDDASGELWEEMYDSSVIINWYGKYEYDDDGLYNDAQIASAVADCIVRLEDGKEEYADEELGKVKVTGIGIAKADINDTVYRNDCIKNCGHIDETYEGDDLVHTQNFKGWIVFIQYEK